VVEVKDQMTLKDDDGQEIKLYRFDNPHVDGMLMGHVVKGNVVWVTDLWSPTPTATKNPNAESVAAALKKFGITGATMAGGHGTNGKQADLEALMAQK
jgi:hypothetical protein